MFPGRATCEPYRAEQRFAGNRIATFEWAAQRCGFGDPPQIAAERAVYSSRLGEHGADAGNVLLPPAVTLSIPKIMP